MDNVIINFLLPYIQFLHGAAYSLHQVLEGLNATSSSFTERDTSGRIVGGGWSPDEAVLPLFGMLIIFSVLLVPFVSMAVYTLGRRKGLLIFGVFLCMPGLLNCLGMFPKIHYMPARFVIHGTGTLGSEVGLIPLLLLGALTGWASIILLYDNFVLTERFRQYYDHMWFPTALVAAVFFVADNGASENTTMLSEASREAQQSSQYLLGQVRRYQDYCHAHGLAESKSCQWSGYAQWTLNNIAEYDAGLFSQFAPDTSAEFYARPSQHISQHDIIDIRKEIAAYNQVLCPVKHISDDISQMAPSSSSCEAPPHSYCSAFPDGPEGLVDRYIGSNTVALASECIIPSLVAKKTALTDLSALVTSSKRAKNYRWLYFIAIAFAVGGKVANSSTKLAEIDTRDRLKRRILFNALGRWLRKLMVWSVLGFNGVLRILATLWAKTRDSAS